MKYSLLPTLLLFFSLFSMSLSAQNVVEEQVASIKRLMSEKGYEVTHGITYGSLNDDEADSYDIDLDKGWDYKICAVCDGDCGDIDLCIFDDNGNQVDCDKQDDDLPILDVSPKYSAEFKLKIYMPECEIDPCKFSIMIFGR